MAIAIIGESDRGNHPSPTAISLSEIFLSFPVPLGTTSLQKPNAPTHCSVATVTSMGTCRPSGAHDEVSCRQFMHPIRALKYRSPIRWVRLSSSGFPPATVMRASSARNFPQNHPTENSGERFFLK